MGGVGVIYFEPLACWIMFLQHEQRDWAKLVTYLKILRVKMAFVINVFCWGDRLYLHGGNRCLRHELKQLESEMQVNATMAVLWNTIVVTMPSTRNGFSYFEIISLLQVSGILTIFMLRGH